MNVAKWRQRHVLFQAAERAPRTLHFMIEKLRLAFFANIPEGKKKEAYGERAWRRTRIEKRGRLRNAKLSSLLFLYNSRCAVINEARSWNVKFCVRSDCFLYEKTFACTCDIKFNLTFYCNLMKLEVASFAIFSIWITIAHSKIIKHRVSLYIYETRRWICHCPLVSLFWELELIIKIFLH